MPNIIVTLSQDEYNNLVRVLAGEFIDEDHLSALSHTVEECAMDYEVDLSV